MMSLHHHVAGHQLEAVRWFERARAACGPSGLFSEEYDVRQRQLRGNLPQGLRPCAASRVRGAAANVTAAGAANARIASAEDRRSRLTRGVIAVIAATAAEAAWTRAQVKMLGGREPVFTPSLMVHRIVLAATGHSVHRRVDRALGVVMRSGYGPSWAAAYVLVRGGRRPRWARDTCILGVVIWTFEIVSLPIVRATPPLRRWPGGDIALDLSNGLVFAAVVNAVEALQEGSSQQAQISREVAGPHR